MGIICLANHPVYSRYIIRYDIMSIMFMFHVNECTFSILYYMCARCRINVGQLYIIYYNVYIILRVWKFSELLKKKRKKFNNDYRSRMFFPLECYMRNYIKKKENALKGFCFTKTDGFTRVNLFHLVRCNYPQWRRARRPRTIF